MALCNNPLGLQLEALQVLCAFELSEHTIWLFPFLTGEWKCITCYSTTKEKTCLIFWLNLYHMIRQSEGGLNSGILLGGDVILYFLHSDCGRMCILVWSHGWLFALFFVLLGNKGHGIRIGKAVCWNVPRTLIFHWNISVKDMNNCSRDNGIKARFTFFCSSTKLMETFSNMYMDRAGITTEVSSNVQSKIFNLKTGSVRSGAFTLIHQHE